MNRDPLTHSETFDEAMHIAKVAHAIRDDEPAADVRRAGLYRAAGHILIALAEMTVIPVAHRCEECMGSGIRDAQDKPAAGRWTGRWNPAPCERCCGSGVRL